MKVAIVIPTWNNLSFLVQTIRSLRERTLGVDHRIICVPNGCTDGTVQWLAKNGVEFVELPAASGFVKSTNAGLTHVKPDEHVLLLNDDVRITDPYWLKRMCDHFEDEKVGCVGPVSNFIFGVQDFRLDNLPAAHDAPFIVGLCMLIRMEAFAKIGLLDEAYGIGTNDDLDYSLSLRHEGYRLLVDRTVFVWHYGSRSLLRVAKNGNLDDIQLPTREILKAKWGAEKCDGMIQELRAIVAMAKGGEAFSC